MNVDEKRYHEMRMLAEAAEQTVINAARALAEKAHDGGSQEAITCHVYRVVGAVNRMQMISDHWKTLTGRSEDERA